MQVDKFKFQVIYTVNNGGDKIIQKDQCSSLWYTMIGIFLYGGACMLTLFIKGMFEDFDKSMLVSDVEQEFLRLRITGTSLDRKLISEIEKGSYNDQNSFIDRFGYKLHFENMSTGCKAALCVANLPLKIINLIGCGDNARDAMGVIFNLCI